MFPAKVSFSHNEAMDRHSNVGRNRSDQNLSQVDLTDENLRDDVLKRTDIIDIWGINTRTAKVRSDTGFGKSVSYARNDEGPVAKLYPDPRTTSRVAEQIAAFRRISDTFSRPFEYPLWSSR